MSIQVEKVTCVPSKKNVVAKSEKKHRSVSAEPAHRPGVDVDDPSYEMVNVRRKRRVADDVNNPYLLSCREKRDNSPAELASYNRDALPRIRKMEGIKFSVTPEHTWNVFQKEADRVGAILKSTVKETVLMKEWSFKEYGIQILGGDAVTISWMVYYEGASRIDVSPTSIRHALNNRGDEIYDFIRSFVGTNEDGTDVFALDWDINKPMFNNYRRSFPIYFPGLCIKLSCNGAHITGPKTVEEFVGVAEFVRKLFTKVSKEETPHELKSFSMSMLNIPIKLSCPIGKAFPVREAIFEAVKKAENDAQTLQVGPFWDNNTFAQRCCINELKFDLKDYAGVNFRYLVHGERNPGKIGSKLLKWPWVTMFDNGKLSVIFSNPNHIINTVKFVVNFLSKILVNKDGSTQENPDDVHAGLEIDLMDNHEPFDEDDDDDAW